ncbi:MAG: hypothetical protein DRJ32_05195 [Thermoprotei archaeon]|mgnify:CR=1 FL=1|nr:MAG: hypothetical protein DRJ32_05195 [Thermoprotei archaeon]
MGATKSQVLEDFLKLYSDKTSTPKTYRYLLEIFFKMAGTTPDDFAEMVKQDPEKAKNLCYDVLHRMQVEKVRDKQKLRGGGYSPKTITNAMVALNQFLSFLNAGFRVKVRGIKPIPVNLDYIPSIEEIEILISKARFEVKPIIALIAFSGMRIGDILKLRYKNIAGDIEYIPEEKKYRAKRLPAKIIVFQEKSGRPYVTFMGSKCCGILTTYLNDLVVRRGRPLEDEDKLFKLTYQAFIMAFMRLVKRCSIQVPSIKRLRPYSLRKYFRLHVSKLGEETAEYLMGHVRGINSLTATYTGLRDLDRRAVEELRKRFAEILPELEGTAFMFKEEVEKLHRQQQEELERLRREVEYLREAHNKLLEILTWDVLEPHDLKKIFSFAYEIAGKRLRETYLKEDEERVKRDFEDAARVVARSIEIMKERKYVIARGEADLLNYLEIGYELVKELSGNRFLLRRPK